MSEKLKCGFGVASEEERREMGRKGARVTHSRGAAHRFEKGKEASEAGHKGGMTTASKYDMSERGRRGGLKRKKKNESSKND